MRGSVSEQDQLRQPVTIAHRDAQQPRDQLALDQLALDQLARLRAG